MPNLTLNSHATPEACDNRSSSNLPLQITSSLLYQVRAWRLLEAAFLKLRLSANLPFEKSRRYHNCYEKNRRLAYSLEVGALCEVKATLPASMSRSQKHGQVFHFPACKLMLNVLYSGSRWCGLFIGDM
jgi:hypothetical protein